MRAAQLEAIDTIISSEAVLISNPQTTKKNLISKLESRIKGVVTASKFVYCSYNIRRAMLQKAIGVTPGRKAPTIAPLEDDAWVSISVMVEKAKIADTMDQLEDLGATDVLVFNIDNCRV